MDGDPWTSPARADANWELFSTGVYKDHHGNPIVLASTSGGAGGILQSAEKIHAYMEQNNYYYSLNINQLKNTFEESKSTRATCCASYVAWVLRDCGLINETSHSAPGLARILENKYGWKRVNRSELQAGDVIVYTYGHVEIYAGNGQIYNAGSDNAILRASPYSSTWYLSNDVYGLRAP